MAKNREVGIRLSVKDADVAKRALEAFGKDGQAALKRIELAGKPASVSLQSLSAATGVTRAAMSGLATGVAGALAGFLSVGAAIAGAKAGLVEFGKVADQAKATGLDAEFFQGLAYQVSLAGVETDGLAAALETFAKNAGLAAEGKGRMVTTLKALNPELLRNIQLATSQEERVRLAADALKEAGSAAEKAALASALFGDQGTKLVAALEGGSAEITAMQRKARDLGLIVDRDLIEHADELGDEFDTTTKILDVQMKQALVSLGPILVSLTGAAAAFARAINDGMRGLSDFLASSDGDLSTAGLEAEFAALDKLYARAHAEVQTLAGDERDQLGLQMQNWMDRMDAIKAELQNRGSGETPPPVDLPPMLPLDEKAKAAIKEAEALIARLRTASESYAAAMADLKEKYDAGLISQETFNRGSAEAALKFAKAADSSDEYAQALERLNEARAAGIITEQAYTDAVADLTKRRLVAQNDWIAGIQLGLMQISDGAKDVASDIANAVTGWADALGEQIGQVVRTGKFEWQDLVKTMLADIARFATQQLITKPLGNLLGSVFGSVVGGGGGQWNIPSGYVPGGFYPGLADGTDFWRGGPTWVGERGPEILNLPRGAQVIPNHKLGGQTVQVNATYHINGSGLSPADLLAVMEQHDRGLMSLVSDRVKKDMKNGAFG